MTCRTRAVVIIALIAIIAARSGEALPLSRGGQFRTKLDSIRNLPPNLMYYTMMKDPEFKKMVNPIPDSEGVRMVGRWCRGPAWNVTGNDSLVFVNLGSECAIVNFADSSHPRVLSEIPASSRSWRSCIQDSLLFIGGCGIDCWNVKHPTAPQFLSRINLVVSDIALRDTFLYSVSADSFCVFNVANPSAPVLLGTSRDTGVAMAITGHCAFVMQTWALAAVDLSDPRHPHQEGVYNSRIGPLCARDTLLFATLGGTDFEVINVADPSNMRMIGSLSVSLEGYGCVQGNFVCLASFAIIDVGDPTQPRLFSQCPMPGMQSYFENAVWVRTPWSYAYVAGAGDGLQIIDVHDPARPTRDSTIMRGGEAMDVAIRSPTAVVATPEAGLRILNVSDPSLPREVGAYDTVCGYWWDFQTAAIVDSYALTAGYSTLRAVKISDPTDPYLAGRSPPSGIQLPTSLVVKDSLLYSLESNRFHIFDISSPTSPRMISELRFPGWTDGLYVSDTLAYAGCGTTGLFIINVARPTAPTIVDTFGFDTEGVFVRDSIAYLTGGDGGLCIANIKDPHAGFVIASVPISGASGVTEVGNLLYIGSANGLLVLDVSNAAQPTEIGHYDLPHWCKKVVVDSGLIYLLHDQDGFYIFQLLPTAASEAGPERSRSQPGPVQSLVSDRVQIQLGHGRGGEIQARVFDIHGRLVLHEMLAPVSGSSSVSLDLSRLPSGVYFIRFRAHSQVTTYKVAKITR